MTNREYKAMTNREYWAWTIAFCLGSFTGWALGDGGFSVIAPTVIIFGIGVWIYKKLTNG